MKLEKSYKREKQNKKKQDGMRISGKSIFIIQRIQIEKSEKIKEAREQLREKSKQKKQRKNKKTA